MLCACVHRPALQTNSFTDTWVSTANQSTHLISCEHTISENRDPVRFRCRVRVRSRSKHAPRSFPRDWSLKLFYWLMLIQNKDKISSGIVPSVRFRSKETIEALIGLLSLGYRIPNSWGYSWDKAALKRSTSLLQLRNVKSRKWEGPDMQSSCW